MRNFILFFISFCFVAIQASGQTGTSGKRPFTKEELQRFEDLCQLITDAFPSSFRNYSVEKKDCKDQSSFNFENDGAGRPLTATNEKNQSAGFLPTGTINYTNPAADEAYEKISNSLDLQKYGNLPDSMNALEARMEKTKYCKTLSVVVSVNSGGKFYEYYHLSTKPELLKIPNAVYASLYRFPFGEPIIEEDGTLNTGTIVREIYPDRAVIHFGKIAPVTAILPATGKQSYRVQTVSIPDDGRQVLMEKVPSFTVFIYGAEEDIRELISKTDWSKVYAVMGQ